MKNNKLKGLLKVAGLSAVLLSGVGQQALCRDNVFSEENSPQISRHVGKIFEDNKEEQDKNITISDILFAKDLAKMPYHFVNPEEDTELVSLKEESAKIYTLKPLKPKVSWTETIFKNQDTGLFIEKDGKAFVSFKGSDRLNTWISDFDALMMNDQDGGRYHQGFLKMFKELESAFYNQLMLFAERNNYSIEEALEKTTFVGHSRGGSAAFIAADISRRKFGIASKVITFGAPRTLHKYTAGVYNEVSKEKTLNISQNYDPAHYIAFSALNGGAHIGNKIYVPWYGKLDHLHAMRGYEKACHKLKNGQIPLEVYEEERDLNNETDHSRQTYVEWVSNSVSSFARTFFWY